MEFGFYLNELQEVKDREHRGSFFFFFKHLEATYNLTTTWIWMQLFWNNGFWELFYLYLFTLDRLIATVLPKRPAKIYPTEKWQNLGGANYPF